jgi:hypothetical protein
MLAYHLPREPSTPRITLWRRLRQIGAVQLCAGVAMLPDTPRAREHLEWLAAGVLEAAGEASVWVASPVSAAVHRQLAERMALTIAAEYEEVHRMALRAAGEPEVPRRRALVRLRRELARIGQRDYFPPQERERAVAAVEGLAHAETGSLTTEDGR